MFALSCQVVWGVQYAESNSAYCSPFIAEEQAADEGDDDDAECGDPTPRGVETYCGGCNLLLPLF